MSLTPDTRLGAFQILALLGEGGMGQVYRARDTRLDRLVAIKILPEPFARDAERLARFEREAKTLAALNHPNIAIIHGLEESHGIRALVMELVEGPTLADRIAHGPIPVDEALPIAKQICEALEGAHEQGIIHRDLKPANIKLRPDGTVKVLDFGLAKALEPGPAVGVNVTASPTVTSPALVTGVGVLLGTAAYMSPEQARGKTADKRSDIWALGCVLYEMLTGQRAFGGEDVTDTLAAVVRSEPAWEVLPVGVPPGVRVFLQRCLQKSAKQRLHDVADMRLALEGAFETPVAPAPVRQPSWRQTLPATLAAVVAALVVGVTVWTLRPQPEPPTVSRFSLALPDGQQFRNTGRPVMAFSPDGRHFVYNTASGLYLRTMDSIEARLLPGTEESLINPFFAPDGQSVGYFQAGQLKRLSISGGAPIVICAAQNPFGVSWERDNTILFAQAEGIMRVSADGGTPELVIRAGKGEQMHGPQLLPDGDTVLFSVATGATLARWDEAQIVAQSLRTGERTLLLRGGSDARYVPTGHLLYALGDGLFAVSFDARGLQVRGGPVSVIDGVMRVPNPQNTTATANYAVSTDGTLVYVAGSAAEAAERMLSWVDRMGREEPLPAPPRAYLYPRLSPDGTRIALDIRDQEQDIWTWDLARHTLTRLTFGPAPDQWPVWTPDGRRLIFASRRGDGESHLYWQPADGTGTAERLTEGPEGHFPTSVSPSGTQVVLRAFGTPTLDDVLGLTLPPHSTGTKVPTPLVKTMFRELNAEVAPDGRWIAYESDESGRREVYVRPFPAVESGRWQVSTAGGLTPLWSRDGRELFYLSLDDVLMGVRVEAATMWRNSTPARILEGRYYYGAPGFSRTFDIAPDGRRFLMVKLPGGEGQAPSQHLVIVQHWTEELKRLVPAN